MIFSLQTLFQALMHTLFMATWCTITIPRPVLHSPTLLKSRVTRFRLDDRFIMVVL